MPPPKNPKTKEDTVLFFNMTANHKGWKIGPDADLVDMLADGLTTNYNRYGYFLCPCRDTGGSRDVDKDIICPCAYSPEDIAEFGHCYCGLYVDPTFLESGQMPQPIPERRPL